MATALLLSSFAMQGCRPCYESVAVLGQATSNFTVTEASRSGTTPVALYASQSTARVDERPYSVIARDQRGDGDSYTMTLYGYETPPGDRIALTVSIPVNAGAGDVFTITRAITPPSDQFAFRPTLATGQVEIGFARSHLLSSPANYAVHYLASTASGQLRVLRRSPGVLELTIDALVTAADGTTYRVVGPISVGTESRGEVCPSIT